MTITRGSGTETLRVGTSNFALGYHANETIHVGAAGAETFTFGANFGTETINGFTASGASADTIQLAQSSFSYLNAGMTQAQDLAAVLAHATSSSSGDHDPRLLRRQPDPDRTYRLRQSAPIRPNSGSPNA